MKLLKHIAVAALVTSYLAAPFTLLAADKKEAKYPLDTCVVSGEKLGEMGKPFILKYEGREVQLCCKNCVADFKKDPKTYLAKLDAAQKKAK